MQSKLLKSNYKVYKTEFWIAAVAFSLGAAMYWWISSLGLARALTDQNAHLNAARLAFDSMTPGISQIGFWPPLLHVLMIPFTLSQNLYVSGGAGAFVLVPALALAAVFLYRLTMLYTEDKFLSIVATLLLVTNPYILYYSVTPMMEVLFLANLFGTAFFLALWLKKDKLVYLLMAGIFITLTTLSRFEGLILIPLVGTIVLIQLVRKRKQYSEIEAVMLMFSILAVLGLAGVMVYDWIFSGSLTTFTGGSWLRNSAEATFPTKHHLAGSIEYMMQASYYMLTKPLVWLSGLSFIIFALFSRLKFSSLAVLSVLVSPFVFVFVTLVSGSGSMAVANLPPFGFFSNERYSLTWIGFVILAPVLLISLIAYYFFRSEKPWMRSAGFVVRSTLASMLLIIGLFQLYNVSFASRFQVIRQNINSPLPSQVGVIKYMQKNYDYGKILITKADNDPILAQSGVDLKQYIYEGNYLYFDQSSSEPWLFARYVIMHNPSDGDPWAVQNESLMNKWGNNQQFNEYYDLVLENQLRRVYKVNEQKVRTLAARAGYNADEIPSINPNLVWWDPANIYAKIQNNPSVGMK